MPNTTPLAHDAKSATPAAPDWVAAVTTSGKRRRGQRGKAVCATQTRSSRRQRKEGAEIESSGGSIRDFSRTRSIARGLRNPDSETSFFNLQWHRTCSAQQQAAARGFYEGPIAVLVGKTMKVVAQYRGGWRCGSHVPFHPVYLYGDILVAHPRRAPILALFGKSWKPGMYQGEGSLKYSDPTSFLLEYTGAFQNGVFHGKGIATTRVGDVYIGDFLANQACGVGTWTGINGDTYSGHFHYGVKHGFGTYTSPGGLVSYKGEHFNGLRQGFGTEKEPYREYTGEL